MKSDGQLSYEGYCRHTNWKSLATGCDLPPWAFLPPNIQAAWEAAAKAVLEANAVVKPGL